MIEIVIVQVAERGVISFWGVVVPAVVLIVAFVATFMLYKHFSKPENET